MHGFFILRETGGILTVQEGIRPFREEGVEKNEKWE